MEVWDILTTELPLQSQIYVVTNTNILNFCQHIWICLQTKGYKLGVVIFHELG